MDEEEDDLLFSWFVRACDMLGAGSPTLCAKGNDCFLACSLRCSLACWLCLEMPSWRPSESLICTSSNIVVSSCAKGRRESCEQEGEGVRKQGCGCANVKESDLYTELQSQLTGQ